MPLQLVVNGKDRTFPELSSGALFCDLVQALGFRQDRVAIERNGEIVARTTWTTESLTDGDRLEVVHFVGGGLR